MHACNNAKEGDGILLFPGLEAPRMNALGRSVLYGG
jgi:hypothetical protein